MVTLSPPALELVYSLIGPHLKHELRSGIANPGSPGYHTSREDLIRQGRSDDYSIQCPADRRGDSRYASGIDITFTELAEQVTVHRRLRSACTPDRDGRADPRIVCVREIIGTLDGRRVSGYNRVATGSGSRSRVGWVTSGFSDPSHLWHEHISVLRDRCDNENDMRGLAEVIAGLAPGALGWRGTSIEQPAFLPVHYVDPAKVRSFLWGVRHSTGEQVHQRQPGFAITTGVAVVDVNGADWLLTEAGYRYHLGYLTTVPPTLDSQTGPGAPPLSRALRVSYGNVLRRTDTARKPWRQRLPGVVEHLLTGDPDVILVCEADKAQRADLGAALGTSWTWCGNGSLGVFWRQGGPLERREEPVRHTYSGGQNRRLLSVPLVHRATGVTVWCDVTHLENDGDPSTDGHRTRKVEATELAERTGSGVRVLGGDFNSTTPASADENPRQREKPRPILRSVGWKFLSDQTAVANREHASHHGGRSATPRAAWIDDLGFRGCAFSAGALTRTDATDASDHHFLSLTVSVVPKEGEAALDALDAA